MTFTPEEAARMAEERADSMEKAVGKYEAAAMFRAFAQALRSRATPQPQEDAMRKALVEARDYLVLETAAHFYCRACGSHERGAHRDGCFIPRIDAALSAKEESK